MTSSHPTFAFDADDGGPRPSRDRRPERADLGRYARLLVDRFVSEARSADQPTFRSIIGAHLASDPDDLAVVEEAWPAFEHVNVQAALDAYLAVEGRSHRLIGLAGYRHHGPFGLGDLLGADPYDHGPRPGNRSEERRVGKECLL